MSFRPGPRSRARRPSSSSTPTESPDEATESFLVWHEPGTWKRIIASKTFYEHAFPAPHFDSVESVIDYWVPPERFSDLINFHQARNLSQQLSRLVGRFQIVESPGA